MVRLTIILLLLLSGFCVKSQKPYLYFNRINTQSGLSHNKVNCIKQDRRGFIWIGTDDGLNRYDGRYFTIFRNTPGDSTTVSGNIITALLEDKDEVLWIATADGGLARYDYRQPAKKQFRQYKHKFNDANAIPVNIINALQEDRYGYLWLATSDHYVLRFDKKKERFLTVGTIGTRTALSLCLDGDTLWVGRQGGGILKVNTKTLSYGMDERYSKLYANLPHAAVTALFKDSGSNIWMGSWDNILYRYDQHTQLETPFSGKSGINAFPDDEVLSFEEDKEKKLWMGGRNYGLTIYDGSTKKFYNYRYDPSVEGTVGDKQVNCIFRDNAGRMWLGTNKGISVYNGAQQAFVQTFLSNSNRDIAIYDFLKEGSGKLWLATSEGIYTRDNDKDSFVLKKLFYRGAQLAVSKFFPGQDGWYIGTNLSLFTYNPANDKIALLPHTDKDSVMKQIIKSRVVSIISDTIDGHPVLLVSPYGHYFAYYDFVDKRWVSRTDTVKKIISRFGIKDNLIRRFYKTEDGTIWLANAKFGLGHWQQHAEDTIRYLHNDPSNTASISNDNLYDIKADARGNLWISTFGGGLNYYDVRKGRFAHAPATNNLLEGIQLDNKQNIWGISNGNIYRYNPYTKTNTAFQLPDLEKSGGVKGNVYKDGRGKMYVAGANYFIEFDPAGVRDTAAQPAVYFTDFKIFNTSFPELLNKQPVALRYFQNYFTIEFSAPEFSGNPVEYSYQLEGVDKNWVETGSRNFANYSNLPGGDYVFKVRATNKKGNWGTQVAHIPVTIIPPFWEAWWFYLLCTTVITAIGYGIYRYRINELLKRQAMRNKIAQDLHDNVGSTLSSISVYSQVAKIYHRQNKENLLDETLQKIGDASGEMISDMSDIVWAINPKNDNVGTIIQRMESFAKPLLQAKGIASHFHYTIAAADVNIPMNMRKNFYLIFKEFINNTLKYAGCKNVEVTITQHHHTIELLIKDDGKGFDMDIVHTAASLSGNGLKNMKARAKEMNASLALTSKPGAGTSLHLTFNIP